MQREARVVRCELLIRGPRVAALALAIGGIAQSSPARAHGSAPSALEVLAVDDADSPTLISLSYGLAKRESSGTFSFVCPAAWGAEDALVASYGRLVAAVVAGRLFTSDGTCSFVSLSLDEQVVDVVRAPAGLLALGRPPGGSRVHLVSAAGASVVAETPDEGAGACVMDALMGTSGGAIVAACTHPRPAIFHSGATERVRPIPLPFGTSRLVPRVVADGTISLLAVASKGSFLVDVAEDDIAAAPQIAGPFATVLGPIRVGSATIAVVDGHLWRRRDGVWAEGAIVPYTCLSQVDDASFACSLGTTWRLEQQGDSIVEAAAVFSLAMLGGPTASCSEAVGEAAVCRGEWGHFGAEAGFFDTAPSTTPSGPRLPNEAVPPTPASTPLAPGGCALGTGGTRLSAGAFLLLACALVFASRRVGGAPFSARISEHVGDIAAMRLHVWSLWLSYWGAHRG